jgi:regulator of protease activity HflC (stomatin/prohibitin superfamily)
MTFVLALLLAVVGLGVYTILVRAGVIRGGSVRSVGGLAIGMFVLLAFSKTVTVIPAGHVGVVDLFGQVSAHTLKSGIQFVNPLARVVKMSIQTQEIKETMDVPSKEGLTMQIEVSVLYHLDPEKAQEVYRTVGEEFVPVLLEPQFRSVTRGVTAAYEAKALYTSEREQLALVIAADLRKLVEGRGVVVEATPMRKLTLPQRLAGAIEEKLGAEQESQRMQFVLQKEKQEADRKRIEAEGISDFQKIVSQGINDGLLRWKGIEATMKIAESANAKVVVIGSGKDGLPIILGDK